MPQRPGEREAGWSLPASLDTLLPANHAVRFVAAYLDGFDATDWTLVGIGLDPAERGAPRYHPRILLAIWVWGFMTGIRSSRKLEAACREMVSFRWLTGQQTPDHNTLWRFYLAHRAGMRYLLTDTVRTAVRIGLLDLALQAVDGTKMAGNAARDRTYDAQGLARLIDRTEQAIRDLEAQNATGGDGAPPTLPAALTDKKALLARIKQVKEELAPGERINLTDREARLLKSRRGYVAGYNAQAVVSPLHAAVAGRTGMLITAAAVITAPDDHEQLGPMVAAAEDEIGLPLAQRPVPPTTLADGGYHSGPTLDALAGQQVLMPEAQATKAPYHKDQFVYDAATDTYTCPRGQTLSFRGTIHRHGAGEQRRYRGDAALCCACDAFGTCTTNARQGRLLETGPYEALLRAQRERMAQPAAQEQYRQRQELIEPVFGILKEQQAGHRFLLRGLQAVRCEWSLLAAAFNLRTLARIWQQNPALVAPALS
jgi:transposase